MSEQDSTNTHNSQQGRTESPLAESLSEVVNAAFGVGAAIAKTLAEATASDKNVSKPEAGQGPLGEMVHYGVTTVTNVVGLVISMMGSAKSASNDEAQPFASNQNKTAQSANASEASATKAETRTPSIPTVHQGGTLRIPLSLENPGDQAMEDLVFLCQQMLARRIAAGQPLTEGAVRFQPERLAIAPKDFEKLTLLIDTDEQTAPGQYVAHIGVAEGGLEINVEFEVVLSEETT